MGVSKLSALTCVQAGFKGWGYGTVDLVSELPWCILLNIAG